MNTAHQLVFCTDDLNGGCMTTELCCTSTVPKRCTYVVLPVEAMATTVSWVVTPCGSVKVGRLDGIYLYFRGRSVNKAKKKAANIRQLSKINSQRGLSSLDLFFAPEDTT
jgi:hypothetical protein